MEKTVIIGGGIAGLTAANYLQRARHPFTLIEASESFGGRVQTDTTNTVRTDRGFQVFLTAYPEAQKILNYAELGLKNFKPGAVIILKNGKTTRIGDPLRDIKELWPTITTPVGTLMDKCRIFTLSRTLKKMSDQQIFSRENLTTEQTLKEEYRFSESIMHHFFRPFFRGIFLQESLTTSRRMFDFVFKMFSVGYASIPVGGIGAISDQLASNLSKVDIQTGLAATTILGQEVVLSNGDRLPFSHLIIATDALNAARLTGMPVPTTYQSTTNMYFTTKKTTIMPRLIHLLPDGLVNNVCDLTSVQADYTASNEHLISVTLRDSSVEITPIQVKDELVKWFSDAKDWRHVRTYQIDYALPDQTNVQNEDIIEYSPAVTICGDHTMNGSLNAAMKSGRLAAERILNQA